MTVWKRCTSAGTAKRLPLGALAVLALLGLGGSFPGNASAQDGEARYFAAQTPGWHSIGNPRFDFWVDLPKRWRAFDRSENGDGYQIEVGNPGVALRVYGSYLETPAEPGDRVERFRFRDGSLGERIERGNEVIFVRRLPERFVFLSVQGPKGWRLRHAATIQLAAASLRPGT